MSHKVEVKVFMPVGVCACSQTAFLTRIYEVVRKYREVIEYTEATAESQQAKDLGVRFRAVTVGGQILNGNPTSAQIEQAILTELGSKNETRTV